MRVSGELAVRRGGKPAGEARGERATAENSVVPFNRLMSYRGVHYRYDEFGRAVEKEGRSGTQSYRYDAEHRMVEVTTARGTYRYVYDALGRRTEKQHISPDGKPYNRTKFYGTECGWRRRAGRREQAACISTATRGVMNRWRGWISRQRGPEPDTVFSHGCERRAGRDDGQ